MSEHQGQTGQAHQVQLASTIEYVEWSRRVVSAGGEVELEVQTHFVGLGAELEVKLTDNAGKNHGTFKDHLYGSRFKSKVQVPVGATDALYAEVKLPKHGLTMKSRALLVTPPVKILNATWGVTEAMRGDRLTLAADIEGAPDGVEALVTVWEYDAGGAHRLVTKLPTLVKQKKVEVTWELQYHEDTAAIPTAAESKDGYRAPEFFFRVAIGGVSAESGRLPFTDWIILTLNGEDGKPIGDVAYELVLPDGQEQEGTLDANGFAKIEKVPPGRYTLRFPDLGEHIPPPGEGTTSS